MNVEYFVSQDFLTVLLINFEYYYCQDPIVLLQGTLANCVTDV